MDIISTRFPNLSIRATGPPDAPKGGRIIGMARFHPARAYNALPPLPPRADLESRTVLKACIEARAALAGLKQAGRLLPNQDVLINTIPLLEARASSEIENIVTTTDQLFRYAQPDQRDG